MDLSIGSRNYRPITSGVSRPNRCSLKIVESCPEKTGGSSEIPQRRCAVPVFRGLNPDPSGLAKTFLLHKWKGAASRHEGFVTDGPGGGAVVRLRGSHVGGGACGSSRSMIEYVPSGDTIPVLPT